MIVVLGSNSFCGSAFVDHALASGSRIAGFTRSAVFSPELLCYSRNPKIDNLEIFQMDINKDLSSIVEKIKSLRPRYIVNFIAQGMVEQSWLKPTHWYQTNVVSQVALIEEIKRLDGLERYVHFSTPEVYGSTSDWLVESFDFSPSTPYAISRAATDQHIKNLVTLGDLPAVITRAANVYGPHQQIYRIIPRAILAARLGRRLKLHGGGVSRRSFLFAHDMSDAVERVMNSGEIGSAYHISTRELVSIRHVVQLVASQTGVDISEFVDIADERRGKDDAYMLDSTKIRMELGWDDRVALSNGIEKVIAWVDRNLGHLSELEQDYVHRP